MSAEIFMTRAGSVAGVLERLIQGAATSVEAALYRFNNSRLAVALEGAARRGVRVRLVVDRGKYESDPVTRELLSSGHIPFRSLCGRRGPGSKMHHKFIILDGRNVMTGSYNWTVESEEENYDTLLGLSDPTQVEAFRSEFEALWQQAWALDKEL